MSDKTRKTLRALLLLAVVLLVIVVLFVTVHKASVGGPKDLSKIAGWKGKDPNSTEAFSFVVVSDRTGAHVEGEWAAAVKQVNLLQPDFVICVGDLIEGYTEDQTKLTNEWDEFEAMTRKFEAPFFYCAGNHDVSNDLMWKIYRQRHGVDGKSYYSFDYRGCHFVVLDSNTASRKESFAKEQFAWLAKDLDRAKDAKHLFVFYHHAREEGVLWRHNNLWEQLRELLPVGKTTIFNGHWHYLNFELAEGIPTYVLAATGGLVRSDMHPNEMDFRMFAQVSVDQGKPTVALIPLHGILPGSYAEFDTNVRSTVTLINHFNLIPPGGGTYTFRQQNPFTMPMTIDLQWKADGWTVEPEVATLIAESGLAVEKRFLLTPLADGAEKPKITATYKFTNPYRKDQVELKRETALGIYRQMDLPNVVDITVDGDLDDWLAVKALPVAGEVYIFSGRDHWFGPKDSSFDLRVATDGKRLFLAVDVTDEQICIDGEQAYNNDGVEIFWDTRPTAKRNGRHGQGTGQVVLAVPKQGSQQIEPTWNMRDRAIPGDLKAICKRREGGYVIELSIPLSELGCATAPIAGQNIWLVAMVNDRDRDAEKETLTHTTTTGLGGNNMSTASYTPWTIK